jgi:hypothetical protein
MVMDGSGDGGCYDKIRHETILAALLMMDEWTALLGCTQGMGRAQLNTL